MLSHFIQEDQIGVRLSSDFCYNFVLIFTFIFDTYVHIRSCDRQHRQNFSHFKISALFDDLSETKTHNDYFPLNLII